MSLWVVRAGRHGEQEETAIKDHLVCHAWNELPDYSAYRTKDDLRVLYKATYPGESEKQVIAGLGQVWRFAHEVQKGDLVALPLKTQSALAFGRITGEYQYKKVAPNVMHIRSVEWLKTVPRSVFPTEILLSMNAALTIFKVYRNDAENRVQRILALAPLSPKSRQRILKLRSKPRMKQSIWKRPRATRYSSSFRSNSKAMHLLV